MGKIDEVRVGAFFAELQRNPVVSAVRGPDSAPGGARGYARGGRRRSLEEPLEAVEKLWHAP